jgi:hypothetical protein
MMFLKISMHPHLFHIQSNYFSSPTHWKFINLPPSQALVCQYGELHWIHMQIVLVCSRCLYQDCLVPVVIVKECLRSNCSKSHSEILTSIASSMMRIKHELWVDFAQFFWNLLINHGQKSITTSIWSEIQAWVCYHSFILTIPNIRLHSSYWHWLNYVFISTLSVESSWFRAF